MFIENIEQYLMAKWADWWKAKEAVLLYLEETIDEWWIYADFSRQVLFRWEGIVYALPEEEIEIIEEKEIIKEKENETVEEAALEEEKNIEEASENDLVEEVAEEKTDNAIVEKEAFDDVRESEWKGLETVVEQPVVVVPKNTFPAVSVPSLPVVEKIEEEKKTVEITKNNQRIRRLYSNAYSLFAEKWVPLVVWWEKPYKVCGAGHGNCAYVMEYRGSLASLSPMRKKTALDISKDWDVHNANNGWLVLDGVNGGEGTYGFAEFDDSAHDVVTSDLDSSLWIKQWDVVNGCIDSVYTSRAKRCYVEATTALYIVSVASLRHILVVPIDMTDWELKQFLEVIWFDA